MLCECKKEYYKGMRCCNTGSAKCTRTTHTPANVRICVHINTQGPLQHQAQQPTRHLGLSPRPRRGAGLSALSVLSPPTLAAPT